MPRRQSTSERALDEHFEATIEVPSSSSRLQLQRTNGNSQVGWLVGTGSTKLGQEAPPFELAVFAGGCASAAVDVIIFPLDSIKTRLQAPQGFQAAGGYRGLFSGVLAAGLGAVPGGAIFFGAYEFSRAALQPEFAHRPAWMLDAMSASCAATASCIVRNPAIVVQQRMQVRQFVTLPAAVRGIAAEGGFNAFYSGLAVSIAREIPFAFIQFPIYEALKRFLVSSAEEEALSPTRIALCGSFAGAVAAAATTPLDLLKTRQMLGGATGLSGLVAEARVIVATEGVSGLFMGVGPRVGWMAVGGYIFFGVYEVCISVLGAVYYPPAQPRATNTKLLADASADAGAAQREPSQHAPVDAMNTPGATTSDGRSSGGDGKPVSIGVDRPSDGGTVAATDATAVTGSKSSLVALLAGGLSGMVIDMALYPIDTFKTRTIQGLVTPLTNRHGTTIWTRLHEMRGLWHGIGVALLPAIPAASVFFVTYEAVKTRASSLGGGGGGGGETFSINCVAAMTAEAAACIIRVPAELLKMKLQSSQAVTLVSALRSTVSHGGVRSLYRGLSATLCLDLPFALLQFPLFEELRTGLTRWRGGDPAPSDGAVAGSVAGALAAFCTTPLDVIRTRHVLWDGKRVPLAVTVGRVYKYEGFMGFWRGVVPRTMYMAMGGALYLGTYSYCTALLSRMLKQSEDS